jgi:8-oxo-dGTP pyrophosphatase MutT (NUDIX family)
MPAEPEDLTPSDTHKPKLPHWETLSVTEEADCRVFRVNRKTCRHPVRGSTAAFFVLDAPDWVNVVAVTTSGEIVLVRQYRYGIEGVSLEVPGGLMDQGEDPITAARRELLEETGYSGGVARTLGRVHPNPAIQNNHCHLVCIEGVEPGGLLGWDEHEEIEVEILPAAEVFKRVRSGEITHALAVNALLLFELEWRAAGRAV